MVKLLCPLLSKMPFLSRYIGGLFFKMKVTKKTLEDEILRVAELYKGSNVSEARNCYEQYVGLVIEDSDLDRYLKNEMFDVWESLKEGEGK